MSIPRGRYSFHSRAGPLAQITNEGLTATRQNPRSNFCNAVLIGAQPLGDAKMFEVRIEETIKSWVGSLIIGCTTSRPEDVWLPKTLEVLLHSRIFMQDLWMLYSSLAFVKHGCNPPIALRYGYNIDSLDIGDTVGIARVGRKLKFLMAGTKAQWKTIYRQWYTPW